MDFAAVWSLLQCVFLGFTDRALKLLSVAREQLEARHHALVTPERAPLALMAIELSVGRVALEGLGIVFQREEASIAALMGLAPLMGHSAGAHLSAMVCTDERYLKAEGLSLANIKGCVLMQTPFSIRT